MLIKSNELMPAIVQDATTREVLMLGYMNQEALDITLKTKRVTFFSRSKQRLWTKGETSGHFLQLQSVKLDCDEDTLLIQAIPLGPTCHKGTQTCWGEPDFSSFKTLLDLEQIIKERICEKNAVSYVHRLVESGIHKVAQKVGEEAVELVIEAMRDEEDLFKNEAADLIFHFLILLQCKEQDLSSILRVLENRKK
jgi:phosphoribosyl-AMP cyclohydrolase / phosphoribosyl-ATP pyrophosphohydrolase